MTDPLLTIAEAAKRLGLSVTYLYREARAGRIDHYRFGRRVMFAPADLDGYLESCRVERKGPKGRGAVRALKHISV